MCYVHELNSILLFLQVQSSIFYNRGCTEDALQECARESAEGVKLQRAMIVTDKSMGTLGYVDRVKATLVKMGFSVSVFDDIHPDPDMDCIRKGVEACNQFHPDLMICLGGGSPMDAGKFIRVL